MSKQLFTTLEQLGRHFGVLINYNDSKFAPYEVVPLENNDTTPEHKRFKELLLQNYETYRDKNRKYGNAFQGTFNELGKISALTRMNDKFSRIKTMIISEEVDNEESLIDSLLDLANYCVMSVVELEKRNDND